MTLEVVSLPLVCHDTLQVQAITRKYHKISPNGQYFFICLVCPAIITAAIHIKKNSSMSQKLTRSIKNPLANAVHENNLVYYFEAS